MTDKKQIKILLDRIYQKVEQPLVFLDIESTGLDLMKDEILQIYLCRYDGKDFTEHNSMYNVSVPITEEAFGKHGFRNEDLVDYPMFGTDAQKIYDGFLTKENILCGFNSDRFDIPFLIEKLLQNKIGLATSIIKNKTIDVYKLYLQMYPNTLEAIYERESGESLTNSHSADADIGATIFILDKMIEKNSEIELVSSAEFLDAGRFFKVEDKKIKFAVGKHLDKDVLDMDIKESTGYLKWITKTDNISIHTRTIAKKLIEKIESSLLEDL